MGLLDDAIREHLELKRRRGADPGEIAHQEHAVLAPAFPPQEAAAAAGADPQDDAVELHREPAPGAAAVPVSAPQVPGEGLHAGEETAEIDMRAVLDGEHVEAAGTPAAEDGGREALAARAPRSEPAGVLDDDALEWEMPGEDGRDDGLTPEIPGQERMSFE